MGFEKSSRDIRSAPPPMTIPLSMLQDALKGAICLVSRKIAPTWEMVTMTSVVIIGLVAFRTHLPSRNKKRKGLTKTSGIYEKRLRGLHKEKKKKSKK